MLSLGVCDGEWHDKTSDRLDGRKCGVSIPVISRNINRPGRLIDVQSLYENIYKENMINCIEERQLPVQEQCGTVQCFSCQKLFRSRGGGGRGCLSTSVMQTIV